MDCGGARRGRRRSVRLLQDRAATSLGIEGLTAARLVLVAITAFSTTGCTKRQDPAASTRDDAALQRHSNTHEASDTPPPLDEFAHQELVALPPRGAPPPFMKELSILYRRYETLAQTLTEGDLTQIDKAAEAMSRATTSVDARGFLEPSQRAWAGHARVLTNSLDALQKADSLVEKRNHFSHASEAMYCALKMFDGIDHTVKVLRCAPGNDAPAAYWLADDQSAAPNPYGRSSSSCQLAESIH